MEGGREAQGKRNPRARSLSEAPVGGGRGVARAVFWGQFHPRFDFIAEHESYHSLDQWFSTGGNGTPQGTFGDVWRHFGCHHWEEKGDAAGTQWVEAGDAATHPAMHRTASMTKHRQFEQSCSRRLPNVKGSARIILPRRLSSGRTCDNYPLRDPLDSIPCVVR